MFINPKLISKDKSKEGVYQQSDKGAIYIFYKEKQGDKIRLDIFNGKKISDINEFKDYNIIDCSDKYNPKDKRTTYYIKPKQEYYTDTLGTTYKTSSICVYIDKNGNYRSFSDDTKNHIECMEKMLILQKRELKTCSDEKRIDYYKKQILHSEKMINKYKKELSRGF